MKTISGVGSERFGVIAEVRSMLREGGVVAVPTDTVYGLIADSMNEQAVEKVFLAKDRPKERALPVFVKDVAMARRFAYISDAKARALGHIWPGKVTVVLHHKEKLPAMMTGGAMTIGIRIPDHPFLAELLATVDGPLAQTSANISNEPPANTAEEVERYFSGREHAPDLIVDGGPTPGTPSTVIDFTKDQPLVLRTGLVSKNELDQILSGFYTG